VASCINTDKIRNRQIIETFLREDPFLHLYSLGDLDDFFWPDTEWIALRSDRKIISIVLVYNDTGGPVLLALNHKKSLSELKDLPSLAEQLPAEMNGHLTDDFRILLSRDYIITSPKSHYKMGLTDHSFLHKTDTSDVIRLSKDDLDEILSLFQYSYPENWFNKRMLETRHYYGIRADRKLVSVAGVHVYSEKYGVAALGNITTHPDFRRKGFAEKVTAHLCRQLRDKVFHIGLNVHVDNTGAIRCYRNLGFEIIGNYVECRLIRKHILDI
jgi:ribosomal protein S18 acetylase RimI-like enzyme